MKETKTYIKLENKPKDNYPEWIIVHHSGGTDKYPLMDTSHHTANDMEAWHLTLGWEGLGYHYVIQKDGEVWLGRPEHYHGAHSSNYNFKSIGICLSGNFDATLPTKAQEESLTKILKSLSERFEISQEKIVPHRKFAKKTCYGKRLSNTWASDLLKDEEVSLTVPKSKLAKIKEYLLKICDK